MTKPLTAIAIANLKSRVHRYEISDAGCQGLRVVVFPSAARASFCATAFVACNAS
jgi:hypothetical protein